MTEHKLTWFEAGDRPDRPVSGTVHVRPDPDDERHAASLAAAEAWAERHRTAEAALDDRDAPRRRVRELERQLAELMPPVPSEAELEQARAPDADVIEIPLPPEPDRSRRLEAYDPGTREVRYWWEFEDGAWVRDGYSPLGYGSYEVMQYCEAMGWRLRSVQRTDGGEGRG